MICFRSRYKPASSDRKRTVRPFSASSINCRTARRRTISHDQVLETNQFLVKARVSMKLNIFRLYGNAVSSQGRRPYEQTGASDRSWPKARLRERLLSTPIPPPDQHDFKTESFSLTAKFPQEHASLRRSHPLGTSSFMKLDDPPARTLVCHPGAVLHERGPAAGAVRVIGRARISIASHSLSARWVAQARNVRSGDSCFFRRACLPFRSPEEARVPRPCDRRPNSGTTATSQSDTRYPRFARCLPRPSATTVRSGCT